jgi:hypothetical protein
VNVDQPGYEASGPPPKVENRLLPDGTFETRTTDADLYFAEDRPLEDVGLQAALDAFRAGGIHHPVVFTLLGRGAKAAQAWRQMEPVMKERGKAVSSALDQWIPHYVVGADVARQLLTPVFGKGANRLFRVPTWPVGYWSVNIADDQHEVYESRTFKDEAAAERK